MSETINKETLHATNHYLYYPDEANIPPYLAYGFRPVFLLLAPYMLISMVLWGLVWSGTISIPFMDDILTWHIYEMLFGGLTGGILAFLATGLPELFPGIVPLVGKRLKWVIWLWIAGRVSFWFIDITGVYLAALLNLAMMAWIIWFARVVILDKLQRHASLGYIIAVIFALETWFFASEAGWTATSGLEILKLSLGAIVILVLLAMRRVNMEAVNELMEDKGIDDIYISRPPKTNMAIFTVALFSVVEFFFPQNSALGWVGLAAGAAILGVTADYKLKDSFILNQPYVLYLAAVYVMLALGYALMGWDLLNGGQYGTNHFRHFVTAGGLGLAYLVVMLIIGWIHTGRHLTSNLMTHTMVLGIVIGTLLRVSVAFFPEHAQMLYMSSALVWALPFALYIKQFFPFLLAPRADGIKG